MLFRSENIKTKQVKMEAMIVIIVQQVNTKTKMHRVVVKHVLQEKEQAMPVKMQKATVIIAFMLVMHVLILVQMVEKEHAVALWETVQVMNKIVMIAMLDTDVNTQAVDLVAQVALVGVTGLTIAQRMVVMLIVLGHNVCGSAHEIGRAHV